jgi:hypothetical protein
MARTSSGAYAAKGESMSQIVKHRSVVIAGIVAILLAATAIFPLTVSTPGAEANTIVLTAADTVGYETEATTPRPVCAQNKSFKAARSAVRAVAAASDGC